MQDEVFMRNKQTPAHKSKIIKVIVKKKNQTVQRFTKYKGPSHILAVPFTNSLGWVQRDQLCPQNFPRWGTALCLQGPEWRPLATWGCSRLNVPGATEEPNLECE